MRIWVVPHLLLLLLVVSTVCARANPRNQLSRLPDELICKIADDHLISPIDTIQLMATCRHVRDLLRDRFTKRGLFLATSRRASQRRLTGPQAIRLRDQTICAMARLYDLIGHEWQVTVSTGSLRSFFQDIRTDPSLAQAIRIQDLAIVFDRLHPFLAFKRPPFYSLLTKLMIIELNPIVFSMVLAQHCIGVADPHVVLAPADVDHILSLINHARFVLPRFADFPVCGAVVALIDRLTSTLPTSALAQQVGQLLPAPFNRCFPHNRQVAEMLLFELLRTGQHGRLTDPDLIAALLVHGIRFPALLYTTMVPVVVTSVWPRVYPLLLQCHALSDLQVLNRCVDWRCPDLLSEFLRIPGVWRRLLRGCQPGSAYHSQYMELLTGLVRSGDMLLLSCLRIFPTFCHLAIVLLEISFAYDQMEVSEVLLSDLSRNSQGVDSTKALCAFIQHRRPGYADFVSMVMREPFRSQYNEQMALKTIEVAASVPNSNLFVMLIQSDYTLSCLSGDPMRVSGILYHAFNHTHQEFFDLWSNPIVGNMFQPHLSATLQSIIRTGDLATFKFALQQPCVRQMINQQSCPHGWTLLHYALRYRPQFAELLLTCPETDISVTDSSGWRPFYIYFLHAFRQPMSVPPVFRFRSESDKADFVADMEAAFGSRPRVKAQDFLRPMFANIDFISQIVNTVSSRDQSTLFCYAIRYKHFGSARMLLAVPETRFLYTGPTKQRLQAALSNHDRTRSYTINMVRRINPNLLSEFLNAIAD